jgi:hypothetical protein
MNEGYSGIERRRHPRYSTATIATVLSFTGRTVCQVENLSACGVLLARALDLPVGTTVEVTLRVPENRPIRVRGHIVRHQENGQGTGHTAIEFHHESDATEAAIQEALLAELERRRRSS